MTTIERDAAPAARLFFASTPMIALSCAAAALAHRGRARLILIEDFDLAERLQRLLERWRDNPFEAIVRLPGRHTEHVLGARHDRRGAHGLMQRVRVKRRLRRQTLETIRAMDAEFRPGEIWLGNDRKPETQLAMHLAGERMGQAVGRYLDDGLYTYLGDVRQRPVVRRVDALVKRLAYGRWWQRAAQAGTTRWIGESWLVYPDDARDRSARRHRRSLPREWFVQPAFLRLGLQAARTFGLDRRQLRSVGLVLVLPHSNQLRANPNLAVALRELIASRDAAGERVAVKYHPRETEPDVGGLLREGVVALPALLPFELLLPLLPSGVRLLGEGSTALLAAHWLRPDIAVADLGVSRTGYAARARRFFAAHGIGVLVSSGGGSG